MYSTNIKDNRGIVDCLIVSHKISLEKFVIDTGVKYTCCSYSVVDERLAEAEFGECEVRLIGNPYNQKIYFCGS